MLLILMLGDLPLRVAETSGNAELRQTAYRVKSVVATLAATTAVADLDAAFLLPGQSGLGKLIAAVGVITTVAGGLMMVIFGAIRLPELRRTAFYLAVVLSPLLYLAILLALNFYVMPYIS